MFPSSSLIIYKCWASLDVLLQNLIKDVSVNSKRQQCSGNTQSWCVGSSELCDVVCIDLLRVDQTRSNVIANDLGDLG